MAARFWVGGTGTWDASDTTHWSATSNGAGGQSVPVAADTVTFDGSSGGGTVTVSHASLSVTSITMGAFTGTWDNSVNNNNVTCQTFSITGTGARVIKLGTGTYLLTSVGNSNPFDATVVTNLDTTAANFNGATITMSAAATGIRTFAAGGLSLGTVNLVDSGGGLATTTLSGTLTIATLNVTGPIRLMGGNNNTITVTNAFTWSGSYPSSMILLESNTGANTTRWTFSCASGTCTMTGAFLRGCAFTGGATFTATDSIDGKGNTGITITNPSGGGSTVVGVIGG